MQNLSVSDSLCVAVPLPSGSVFSAMAGQIDARLTVPSVFGPATPCTHLCAQIWRPHHGAASQGETSGALSNDREAKGGSGAIKSIYKELEQQQKKLQVAESSATANLQWLRRVAACGGHKNAVGFSSH